MKKFLLAFLYLMSICNLYANSIYNNCLETTLHSKALQSDINLVVYNADSLKQGDEATLVFYIFGDFLFHPFAGSVQYLSQELDILKSPILVGINEIEGKSIGEFKSEYAEFINKELIDHFSKTYSLKNDCVLLGHSRATHLVAEVMQNDSQFITNFILSAPWFGEEILAGLENSFDGRSNDIKIYLTLSEEDFGRDVIKTSLDNTLALFKQYGKKINCKYHYLPGESHMSIPPLSFYYGIKYLLCK